MLYMMRMCGGISVKIETFGWIKVVGISVGENFGWCWGFV